MSALRKINVPFTAEQWHALEDYAQAVGGHRIVCPESIAKLAAERAAELQRRRSVLVKGPFTPSPAQVCRGGSHAER